MDLEEFMTYGCTSLAWVTKWLFLEKSPSLTKLTFWKMLSQTICQTPRMAWHCYIPSPTFPRSVMRYAYRFSIRRRSRLTVIILGLSKRRGRSSPEIILAGSAVRQPYYSKSFHANYDTTNSYVSYAVWTW